MSEIPSIGAPVKVFRWHLVNPTYEWLRLIKRDPLGFHVPPHPLELCYKDYFWAGHPGAVTKRYRRGDQVILRVEYRNIAVHVPLQFTERMPCKMTVPSA